MKDIEKCYAVIYAIMKSTGIDELYIPENAFEVDKNCSAMVISYDTETKQYKIVLKGKGE